MTENSFEERVTGIASLGEPVRRLLYRFVARQPRPVSREQAASGVGVPLHVAKFHLDRLEQDGLLEAEFRRPPGKAGPGAGRPAKLYRRSGREVRVSLPERRYDLAGLIMARAISAARNDNVSLEAALREAAVGAGRSLGEEARRRADANSSEQGLLAAAREVIDAYGYESRVEGERLILANCPFHALAEEHRDLVCGMNLDLMEGLLKGLGATGIEAQLDPAPGRCCVTMTAH